MKLRAAWPLAALLCAAAADAAPTRLQDCAGIASATDRLACFDALAAAAVKPVAQPPSPMVAAPASAPEAGFGAETLKKAPGAAEAAESIRSPVVSPFDGGWDKGALIKLDNGQVWKYIDDQSFYYPDAAPVAIIRRNFMGSYFLQLESGSKPARVRRVQ